jgi:hypothetical protein
MPSGNCFVPLVDAVLQLGEMFEGRAEDYMSLLSYDDWLHERLIERAVERSCPSDKALDVYRLLHAVFTSTQGAVNLVCRILTLLSDIRSDPYEATLQRHPLVDYADCVVARAMAWCRSTLVELGIPDAITRSNLLTFNVNFDLTPETYDLGEGPVVELWPSQQALLFLEHPAALPRHPARIPS